MSLLRKDEGYILRTVKFGETSLIADILTLNDGLRSFVIKGARRQKSSFSPAALQLMAPVTIDYYTRERSGLNQLKELRLNYFWERIPLHFPRRAVGIFICEVTRKSTERFQPNPELYALLNDTLHYLDNAAEFQNLHLWYLARLATEMGFGLQTAELTQLPYFDLMEGIPASAAPYHGHYIEGKTLHTLHLLNTRPLEHLQDLNCTNHTRRLLLDALIEYFRLHQHGIFQLQSLSVLKEIFI